MKLQEVFSKKTYRPRLNLPGPAVGKKVSVEGHFAQAELGAPTALTNTKTLEDFLAALIVYDHRGPDAACQMIRDGMDPMMRSASKDDRRQYVEGWWYRLLHRGGDKSLQVYNPAKNDTYTLIVEIH